MKSRGLLKNCVVIFLVLFLILPFAYSLTATISNPRMVLYENITKGEMLTIENSVIVANDNDHEVIINVVPTGTWEGRVEIGESNFILQEGEKKEVFYTITIDEAGVYQGDILVTFEEDDSKNILSLAQELEVFVKEEGQDSMITGNAIGGLTFGKSLGIGFTLILSVTLLITIKLMHNKK